MSLKKYIEQNVYDAAVERITFILQEFERVYFSVSFGKDSSVMLQIALDVARKLNKLPLNVMYIDFEAQYGMTIEHAKEMLSLPEIKSYWICLPISLRNAVSVYQPQWVCWDEDDKDKWVRELPAHLSVINDLNYFPFFFKAMEFEQFIVEFGKWFSENGKYKTACGVGIRTDESLNRFRTIANMKKTRYKNRTWTTEIDSNLFNFYPLYDWKTEDIWTAVGKNDYKYNRIYDVMFLGGMSIHEARLCQPYGDDQKRGLNIFQRCEPQTWGKIVNRVSGANFGKLYANSFLMGHQKILLPEGHTWKSYLEFLLETLPKFESEWYKAKFTVFLKWWTTHGYPNGIPDCEDPKLEAAKKVPSYRRMVKCIIKNDKLCKNLSFGQSNRQYEKYMQFKELYGE